MPHQPRGSKQIPQRLSRVDVTGIFALMFKLDFSNENMALYDTVSDAEKDFYSIVT